MYIQMGKMVRIKIHKMNAGKDGAKWPRQKKNFSLKVNSIFLSFTLLKIKDEEEKNDLCDLNQWKYRKERKLILLNVSKVDDRCRERPEGSLFISYYTSV